MSCPRSARMACKRCFLARPVAAVSTICNRIQCLILCEFTHPHHIFPKFQIFISVYVSWIVGSSEASEGVSLFFVLVLPAVCSQDDEEKLVLLRVIWWIVCFCQIFCSNKNLRILLHRERGVLKLIKQEGCTRFTKLFQLPSPKTRNLFRRVAALQPFQRIPVNQQPGVVINRPPPRTWLDRKYQTQFLSGAKVFPNRCISFREA